MSWPFNYSLSSIHTHKNNRPHKTFQQANFCSCDFSFIFHEIAYPFKRIFEYNDSFLSSPYHIFHQMTLFSNDVENNCPVWWILCLLYISRWISEYIQRFEVCNSLHGFKKKKNHNINTIVQYSIIQKAMVNYWTYTCLANHRQLSKARHDYDCI